MADVCSGCNDSRMRHVSEVDFANVHEPVLKVRLPVPAFT